FHFSCYPVCTIHKGTIFLIHVLVPDCQLVPCDLYSKVQLAACL
ncbi:hypothetical protein EJB05_26989, partial [Eragrostis curvula]